MKELKIVKNMKVLSQADRVLETLLHESFTVLQVPSCVLGGPYLFSCAPSWIAQSWLRVIRNITPFEVTAVE